MTDDKQNDLLNKWKECLDEMAGTEYDCSFDCGSHQGENCYHGDIFRKEEEKAAKILEELLGASKDPAKTLQEAEKECNSPERQGWGARRGLSVIERFRR